MIPPREQPRLKLTGLPTEILIDNIAVRLGPKDFIALCSITKTLRSLLATAFYWRKLTCSTFRLPDQPLLKADGERWMWLYKKLSTQCRVFTWGDNKHGALGHSWKRDAITAVPQPTAVPREMVEARERGIVVDLQCGGWSTTFLNSAGELYGVGILDGLSRDQYVSKFRNVYPRQLKFHSDGTPHTTIAQFSSGRRHILGLSDTGTIWSWNNFYGNAVAIDLQDGTSEVFRVKRVVAGWSCSSAYVFGKGIAIWIPAVPTASEIDALVRVSFVPSTWYRRPTGGEREASAEAEELGRRVGEVINHVVLEGYVVFLTDLGKVFAARITDTLLTPDEPGLAIELTTFTAPRESEPMAFIQGSFRNFAVFSASGLVYCGTSEHLNNWWNEGREGESNPPSTAFRGPDVPPGLQNRDIISIAFGDWHMHALTADGHILSFGREPRSVGCFGLGAQNQGGQLRGVRYLGYGGDSYLIDSAKERGRVVWFEPEKLDWLLFMACGGIYPDPKMFVQWTDKMKESEEFQTLVNREFERLGEEWHNEWEPTGNGDGLDELSHRAYFAISIAAGGSHSGALTLVNDRVLTWQRTAHGKFLPVLHPEHRGEEKEIRDHTGGLLSKKLGPWSGPSSLRCRLPFLPDPNAESLLSQPEPRQAPGHDNGSAFTSRPVHPGERGHGPVVHPGHPPVGVRWERSIDEPFRGLSAEASVPGFTVSQRTGGSLELGDDDLVIRSAEDEPEA